MPKKYRYCCVLGCNNNTKNSNVVFLPFPCKDSEWRLHWLKKIGRLDLLNSELQCESVCEIHFEREYFETRKRLFSRAIPTLHLCQMNTVSSPPQILQPEKLQSMWSVPINSVQQMSTNNENQTETLITYQDHEKNYIDTYVVEIKSEDDEVEEDEAEAKETKEDEAAENEINEVEVKIENNDTLQANETLQIKIDNVMGSVMTPDEVASVVYKREIIGRFNKLIWLKKTIQNKYKGKNKSFLFKIMALNLRILSPQTYRSLREILKLPSERILKELNVCFPTKLNTQMLHIIICKLRSLPDKAKHCTLCIGRMCLKQNIYYNTKRDQVMGLETVCGNKTKNVARYVYVAIVRGLLVDWKQPIAYSFFSSGNHTQSLELWTLDVINNLLEIGIEIKALVANPECNYNFAHKLYLCDIDKLLTFCKIKDRMIPFIFDVPHLFRRIRNTFLCNQFVSSQPPIVEISYKYICEVFELKFNNLNLLPNITSHHIYPKDAEKLRIDYATKIFSQTVYTALKAYIYMKYLPERATHTADFILLMNDLFDILNSSEAGGRSKYQRPFSFSEDQMEVLNRTSEKIKNLIVTSKSGNPNVKLSMNFKYLCATISSIISVCKELQAEGAQSVYTRKLNLEPIDEYFMEIRKEVGRNRITACKFEKAFSKLVIRYALKASYTGSRVLDPCDYMSLCPIPSLPSKKPDEPRLGFTDYHIDIPGYNGLFYVASFLMYACSTVHGCVTFQGTLASCPFLNDIFNYFKAFNKESSFYGQLKVPPDNFFKYVKQLELVTMKLVDKVISENPCDTLMNRLIPFDGICKCFPGKFVVKLFIRLKIYTSLKFNESNFRTLDKQARYIKTGELLKQHLKLYRLKFKPFV